MSTSTTPAATKPKPRKAPSRAPSPTAVEAPEKPAARARAKAPAPRTAPVRAARAARVGPTAGQIPRPRTTSHDDLVVVHDDPVVVDDHELPKLSPEALRAAQAETLATPRRSYSLGARLLFLSMDAVYGRRRTLAKFRVLEVVARVPYQSW